MEFAEHILTPKVEGVWYYDGRRKAISGALCLTGHHMILYAEEKSAGEIQILYRNIDAIDKRFGVDKGTLILKCKDLLQIQLTIPGVEDATNIATTVETLSNLIDPTLQYPFFYRAKFIFEEDGWDLYCVEHQFASLESKSDRWRISEVNSDYSICPTYPSRVIVPKVIDDAALQRSAKFRHLGRFPVLSYFHTNGAAVLRSSQPLLGTGNRRCKDDEKLINAMLGASHRGYVLDIRSSQSAVQAKTKGGGFESEHHYPRWKRVHLNLNSYYVQQESLIRLVEACNDKSGNMDRWMSKLESSNWMGHVKSTLDAACLVAQCIDREGWSVLVHGSEGVDSTLSVTSLSQIILDPECRTIRGFLTLIDREYINGGHPFTDRCSHAAYSNAKQRAEGPVFAIFLECVYQLVHQFPMSFEFTSTLLVDLRIHAYASPFGTFLFNNMQERARCKVSTKTTSLWSYILSPSVFSTYINPLYRRKNNIIWPSVAPQSLDFWEDLYTLWLSPSEQILEKIRNLEGESEELKYLVSKLSKKVAEIDGQVNNVTSKFSQNSVEEEERKPEPGGSPTVLDTVLSIKERKQKKHHSRKPVKKLSSNKLVTSPDDNEVITEVNHQVAVEACGESEVRTVTNKIESVCPDTMVDGLLDLGSASMKTSSNLEESQPDPNDQTLTGSSQDLIDFGDFGEMNSNNVDKKLDALVAQNS